MTYDAVIVGGGFAGLTAANHIALAGLKPTVLEAGTQDLYMCNSRVATGALHVAFRSPEDPSDELFDTIMAETDGAAREAIAQALTENAQATIDWMRDEGCEFMQHPRQVMGNAHDDAWSRNESRARLGEQRTQPVSEIAHPET